MGLLEEEARGCRWQQRPAPGAHFFALDEGGVLFYEPAQRFYDLNATAALCWLALAEGLPETAIIEELVAAGAPARRGAVLVAAIAGPVRSRRFSRRRAGGQPTCRRSTRA